METFAKKVKKFLKRGKSAQLNKFQMEVIDILQEQRDQLEKDNRRLIEKVERQQEAKRDFIFNIDTDRLGDVDGRHEYVEEYATELVNYDRRNIDELRERIEDNKERIKMIDESIRMMKEAEPNVEEEEEED